MSDVGSAVHSQAENAASVPSGDRQSSQLPPLPRWWEGGVAALYLYGYLALLCGQVVAVLVYPLLPSRAGSSPAIPQEPAAALVIAVVVTIVVWALEFLVLRAMTSAPKAQPRFYTELIFRYQQVRDRWAERGTAHPPIALPVEVKTQLEWATRALTGEDKGPGLRWAMAYGYVSVLRAVHFAEEALILVERHDRVLSDTVLDELSLKSSTIQARNELVKEIEAGRTALRSNAAEAPHPQAPAPPPPTHASGSSAAPLSMGEGLERLRLVRYAIDNFRDDLRDGVIRARNRLILVTFVVSTLTFLLLGLAEVVGVPSVCLTSVAALYLVGAIVGCFNRLRIEAKQSSAGEDFGFYQMRLMAVPLMSGLAAVGGVYLVAALPALLPVQGEPHAVPALWAIFDLSSNGASLLYAAVFGLVPETLTKWLLGAADKLQSDLLASRPINTETT
jgi:hypothetical protein